MNEVKTKIKVLFEKVQKVVENEPGSQELLLIKQDMLELMKNESQENLGKCEEIKKSMIELQHINLKFRFERNLDMIFAHFSIWESNLKLHYEILPLLELTEKEEAECVDLDSSIMFALGKLRKEVKAISEPILLSEFNKLKKNFKELLSPDFSYKPKERRAKKISKQLYEEIWADSKEIQFLRLAVVEYFVLLYLNTVIGLWS